MGFLTLENVSHHYFSKNSYTKSLNNISFSIKENEFIALLGPSGCGKSTVLSILAGIMDQTEGHILINQKPIHQSQVNIGYMHQEDYLFPWKKIILLEHVAKCKIRLVDWFYTWLHAPARLFFTTEINNLAGACNQ